jgi:hypothetical protein
MSREDKETDHLWTPEYILDVAERVLGRHSEAHSFGLDPCWNAASKVSAETCWTVDDDALAPGRDWYAHGSVWLNPPYSNPEPFLANMKYCKRGMALVKHDHSTAWWREHCSGRPICMLFKRPKFGGGKGSGTFPSTLVLFEYDYETRGRFLSYASKIGEVRL